MNTTPNASAGEYRAPKSVPKPTHSVEKLRETVEMLDCMSQRAFDQIRMVARLALARLEQPDAYGHPEEIAIALQAIWDKATETMDTINSEAGSVDCDYVDEAAALRHQARDTARAQRTAGSVV